MHVMMKITDFCNMGCTYCYVPEERRDNKKILSLDELPSLYKKIFEWQQSTGSGKGLHFNWAGGEVLTVPLDWWREAMRIQRDCYREGGYSFGVSNGIQTNMTLMNDEYIKFILENKIDIGISMDGPKKCMDKTRVFADGRSAFSVIEKNLKRLIEVYGYKPGVIVVLTKHNINHLEEIFYFFKKLGITFQVNSYHYAPSSVDKDSSNTITAKEYLKAMCQLFDLWSRRTDSTNIANFERMTKFLLHGRAQLCCHKPTCADQFYMIRSNGDVYPCNEFEGTEFEHEYCYGNLFKQDWREIRDHPTRQLLLKRALKIKQADECKGCRFWKGCYGGCFHSGLKNQYRNSLDYSPEKVASMKDTGHCQITYGLYEYIEKRLEEESKKNLLPVLLYTKRDADQEVERKEAFYEFHRQSWEASRIDPMIKYFKLRPAQLKLLTAQLSGKKDILHVCSGDGSLLNYAETQNGKAVKMLGLDYRSQNDEMNIKFSKNRKNVVCENVMKWQGWRGDSQWDAIVIASHLIHSDDLGQLLLLCRSHLKNDGVIILYSPDFVLREQEIVDMSLCQDIKEFDPNVIPISCAGITIAVLEKPTNTHNDIGKKQR